MSANQDLEWSFDRDATPPQGFRVLKEMVKLALGGVAPHRIISPRDGALEGEHAQAERAESPAISVGSQTWLVVLLGCNRRVGGVCRSSSQKQQASFNFHYCDNKVSACIPGS